MVVGVVDGFGSIIINQKLYDTDSAMVFSDGKEATLADGDQQLRPGMHGVAKIATERDPLIWVLIHPLIEKLSLWFWSIL